MCINTTTNGACVFPIRPNQVTQWSSEVNCNNRGKECSFCGICKKEFIIGSLIEVFLKNTNYPVALIEKVKCADLVNCIPKMIKEEAEKNPERFIRWNQPNVNELNQNRTDQISAFYINYDGEEYTVYHSYMLSMFLSGCNPCNDCYLGRKGNVKYDECMQSDLKNAKEVFNTKQEKPYECNLTKKPLMEIAYPILTENNSCVAVMIIGQIPKEIIDKDEQVLNDLRDNVHEFEEVIKEQINLKNKAFLSEYLESLIRLPVDESQLKKDLEKNKSNKSGILQLVRSKDNELSIEQHIYSLDLKMLAVLKQASRICDEILLYYNPEVNANYCHILEASNGEKPFLRIIKTKTIKTKQEAVQELVLPIFINNDNSDSVDEKDGFVHLFDNNDSPNYYVGILFHWNDYQLFSHELRESIKRFVTSLGKAFHDVLMTHISTEKQRMLSDLVQTLSHDLNQKIEIVGNHTVSAERKIITLNADPLVNAVFYDYAKDVLNMTHQLRHFVEDTRAKANNESVPHKRVLFSPYRTYLFNLNEYYTIKMAKNLRAFYSPSVTEVCSTHPWRYPEMKADPVLMERCTTNLLSNAEKYSFSYTNIFLDCYYDRKEDPQYYILRVTDFGKKIPESFVNLIFEYGLTGPNNKGKGIGLAVVKEICEIHNGFVELEENRIISDYNIPLLYRVIQETNKDKQQFDRRFPDVSIDYNELLDEYNRLHNESVEGNNYVAKQKFITNQLSEVCARSINYNNTLTKRFFCASINRPTARISFVIKIPMW